MRYAIGASIVSVIATSSGAAATYVRERLANIRVTMLLELGTTTGAITGAFISGWNPGRFLFLLFGALTSHSSLATFAKRSGTPFAPSADRWAGSMTCMALTSMRRTARCNLIRRRE